MQGIYTYTPETNYVRREYSVAAILLLLFMVLISLVPVLNLLYPYNSTYRSMCAVSNMAVFCSSLTSCFPGVLLTLLLLLLLLLYALIYGDDLDVYLSTIPSEDTSACACECKFDVSVFSVFEDDQSLVYYNI